MNSLRDGEDQQKPSPYKQGTRVLKYKPATLSGVMSNIVQNEVKNAMHEKIDARQRRIDNTEQEQIYSIKNGPIRINDHFKVSLKASQKQPSGDSSTLVESTDTNKAEQVIILKGTIPKENVLQQTRSGSKTDRSARTETGRAGSIKTGKDEQTGVKKEYTLHTLDNFLRSKNIASK